jgi:hypothetical protein
MSDKTLIAYDEETVIIGFINSYNELEYTIYSSLDGGTTSCRKGKFLESFTDLCDGEISADIKEIIDVKTT